MDFPDIPKTFSLNGKYAYFKNPAGNDMVVIPSEMVEGLNTLLEVFEKLGPVCDENVMNLFKSFSKLGVKFCDQLEYITLRALCRNDESMQTFITDYIDRYEGERMASSEFFDLVDEVALHQNFIFMISSIKAPLTVAHAVATVAFIATHSSPKTLFLMFQMNILVNVAQRY